MTAVKQANDDLAQARHIVETGLDLYAGDDNILQPFLELGGVGGICVHTHVVGPQVAEQVRAVREGDLERAREIDRELEPSYDLLKVVANPIAIKAALNLLGHEVGGVQAAARPADRGGGRRGARLSCRGSGCSSPLRSCSQFTRPGLCSSLPRRSRGAPSDLPGPTAAQSIGGVRMHVVLVPRHVWCHPLSGDLPTPCAGKSTACGQMRRPDAPYAVVR